MEDEFRELDAQNGWAQLFQQIRNESSNFDFTMKEAKKTQNKNLNRYRDVSPYDHSRVKLDGGVDGDYINASLLEVSDARRSYILTQGPLPNTTGHFWQMVWERNSKAVLMLNKVIEKNTIKCHQYWPLGQRHNGLDILELPAVDLRVEYVSQSEASYYVLRRLKITELKSGDCRIVLHFHYTDWPDFSVPKSPSHFLDFLFAVRDSGALEENVGPPVVHCSAGIGRSGTFCLVDSCLVLIEKYQDLNSVDIKKMLLEMRKYRMGLIQTHDQLRFSYLAILEGAKRVSLFASQQSNDKSIVNSKRLSKDLDEDIKKVLENGNATAVNDDDENDDDEDVEDASDDNAEDLLSSTINSRSLKMENANSVPASAAIASKHRWLHNQEDAAPPLPPKRRRSSSSSNSSNNTPDNLTEINDDTNSSDEAKTNKRLAELVELAEDRCNSDSAAVLSAGCCSGVGCERLECHEPGVDSGSGCTHVGDHDDDELVPLLNDNDSLKVKDSKECCMTMKDGAVLTNFGERLREAELRKRQRKERNEKMRDKIRTIQQKQQECEKGRRRGQQHSALLKPIASAVGIGLLILGGGYLVYRYFWKGA